MKFYAWLVALCLAGLTWGGYQLYCTLKLIVQGLS